LSQAVRLIKENNPGLKKFDPYKFPLDDKPTFALLQRGETKGIFQLESGGIRDLLTRMKPDHFRDIIATNALYRPGPLEGGMVDEYIEVKNRRKSATYLHPIMKDVLEETHGVMVYQEQVMRILNRLGGIPLPNSYSCIKAISKKKLELIAKYRDQFIKGAVEKGLKQTDMEELFGMIEKFAGYGFNKSHSTAYALIAYMTAYLKAHYPVEFMAALLTSDQEGRNFKRKDPLVEHIEDCRRMNLTVVAPDVNHSEFQFTTKDGQIMFALGAIKGCGEAASYAISSERKKNGPFKDLFDFCERVDMTQVSRSTLENLVKAGAMDSLSPARHRLFAGIEKAMQSGSAAQGDRRIGQKNLFAGFDDEPAAAGGTATAAATVSLPDAPAWKEKERLTNEKEVLGFYLTSHPLAEHESSFKSYCSHQTPELLKLKHKDPVLLGGMLASIKLAHSKKAKPGNPSKYAMFDLEDMEGMVRCIVWPEQYAQFGQFVQADAILALRGVVDRRPGSEEVNLIVDEVIPLEELEKRYTDRIVIRLVEGEHTPRNVEQLYEVLRGYPGNLDLHLVLYLQDGTRAHLQCEKLKVSLDREMRAQVEELLGSGNIRLIGSAKKALAAARAARRQQMN
ncbi:MAG TPA: DNA polymerase III subunit alpha, partial [Pirellulales bacterium]